MSCHKPMGTSILFVNSRGEILLLLRDDKPDIKFPNMWDIPGGNIELGETPEGCISREIDEEFGIAITDFQLFEKREFSDRIEFTFWQRADFDVQTIKLTEGQKIAWFSEEMANKIQLAFNFNVTVNSFYQKAPFNSTTSSKPHYFIERE